MNLLTGSVRNADCTLPPPIVDSLSITQVIKTHSLVHLCYLAVVAWIVGPLVSLSRRFIWWIRDIYTYLNNVYLKYNFSSSGIQTTKAERVPTWIWHTLYLQATTAGLPSCYYVLDFLCYLWAFFDTYSEFMVKSKKLFLFFQQIIFLFWNWVFL